MHRQIYSCKWDVKKGQELHRKHIRHAKSLVDNTMPRPQPHLITNAKKHELEEDRFAEIERENAVLLSKMSKIMREGPGTATNGGAPEKEVHPRPPKSLNRGFRRKELDRITQENLSILKRIQMKDPHYNHLEWKEERRRNKAYMRNACELPSPSKSRFVDSLRHQTSNKSGSQTTRTHRHKSRRARNTGAMTDRSFDAPVQQAGNQHQVRPDDIKLLLGMRRPPELVKKVFSALMLLVSPFETSEADICWDAVQGWLVQLKGVQAFVDNLNHFDAHIIERPVVTRTVDYLFRNDLSPEKVALFSAALASLASWIWGICEESCPGIAEERESEYRGPSIARIEEDAAVETESPVAVSPPADSYTAPAPVSPEHAPDDSMDQTGVDEGEADYGFARGSSLSANGTKELVEAE